MSLELWLAFAAASATLLALPGPTLMLVLSYAMTQGRRVAIASALGVAVGDLIAMTISVIGLGALFLASAMAFSVSTARSSGSDFGRDDSRSHTFSDSSAVS
jgi:threonine/homoserine/homoserine lactone efflux protein